MGKPFLNFNNVTLEHFMLSLHPWNKIENCSEVRPTIKLLRLCDFIDMSCRHYSVLIAIVLYFWSTCFLGCINYHSLGITTSIYISPLCHSFFLNYNFYILILLVRAINPFVQFFTSIGNLSYYMYCIVIKLVFFTIVFIFVFLLASQKKNIKNIIPCFTIQAYIRCSPILY